MAIKHIVEEVPESFNELRDFIVKWTKENDISWLKLEWLPGYGQEEDKIDFIISGKEYGVASANLKKNSTDFIKGVAMTNEEEKSRITHEIQRLQQMYDVL